jgi:hypothetical protein
MPRKNALERTVYKGQLARVERAAKDDLRSAVQEAWWTGDLEDTSDLAGIAIEQLVGGIGKVPYKLSESKRTYIWRSFARQCQRFQVSGLPGQENPIFERFRIKK